MANIISIASKPAEGAFAPQPEATSVKPSAAPPDEVLVTERAIERIHTSMVKEDISPSEGGLRVGVVGGGCSGMSYSMRLEKHSRENDHIFEFGGVRIFIDPKSFIYLHGMTLDYEETLIRQGFTFSNPNSARSCSCGTSFSV